MGLGQHSGAAVMERLWLSNRADCSVLDLGIEMPLLTLIGCHIHVVRLFQPNGTKIMAQLLHGTKYNERFKPKLRTEPSALALVGHFHKVSIIPTLYWV